MQIKYHRKFEKSFKKLDQKIKLTFYSRLKLFYTDRQHPILNNHSVDGIFPSCRSINITGDYRAIYCEGDDSVTFILIGKHSQLYK